jgi:hypothetical protein
MPPAEFEPTIPTSERPQTHSLDCAVSGIGDSVIRCVINKETMNIHIRSPPSWGLDVPLATALSKTFLLRMLNDS